MSTTYKVDGYVDVRVFIDDLFNASHGATPSDVAEMIGFQISCKVGKCEILNHLLQIRE